MGNEDFTLEISSRPLDRFYKLNDNYWLYRKDFFEEMDSDGNIKYQAYSKRVTTAEKEILSASIDGVSEPIKETENTLDANDTVVMEALADIYATLEQLKEAING